MRYNPPVKSTDLTFGLLRVPVDAIAVGGALILAYYLRTKNIDLVPGIQLLDPNPTLPDPHYYSTHFLLPWVGVFLILAALLKLYLIRITLSAFREFMRIGLTTLVWMGLIMGWFFLIKKELFFSRMLLLHGVFFTGVFVTMGRIYLTLLQRILLHRGIGVRHVLSFGGIPLAPDVEQYLLRDYRYRYLGHVPTFDSFRERTSIEKINLVIHTDPGSSDETSAIIDICRNLQIGYGFLPPVLIDVPHLLSVYRFGPAPLIRFHPTPLDGWGAIFKRTADVTIALPTTILLSPFFALIALMIKLDSRGPIFYRSLRIGQNDKEITVLKFRSMVKNADELKKDLEEMSHRDGPLFKVKNDPRVTRVGKFLRRFSIDEWPQLINVIRGDLSLVGPRPHLPEEVSRYTAFQRRVFTVKPGITGLPQISGRSDLSFEQEVKLDLRYIEEWRPWLDLWILWRTVWVVLKGKGAD